MFPTKVYQRSWLPIQINGISTKTLEKYSHFSNVNYASSIVVYYVNIFAIQKTPSIKNDGYYLLIPK